MRYVKEEEEKESEKDILVHKESVFCWNFSWRVGANELALIGTTEDEGDQRRRRVGGEERDGKREVCSLSRAEAGRVNCHGRKLTNIYQESLLIFIKLKGKKAEKSKLKRESELKKKRNKAEKEKDMLIYDFLTRILVVGRC